MSYGVASDAEPEGEAGDTPDDLETMVRENEETAANFEETRQQADERAHGAASAKRHGVQRERRGKQREREAHPAAERQQRSESAQPGGAKTRGGRRHVERAPWPSGSRSAPK